MPTPFSYAYANNTQRIIRQILPILMSNEQQKTSKVYDLFVIGGGINGIGIALDAAGRGYSVVLCEQNDLASATSSASTKLIHGGLRYLEYYEFRLVREALIEREILLQKAPHLIRPQLFIMPHHKSQRPAWLIRIGLWLYDFLGRRKTLGSSKTIALQSSIYGAPLQNKYRTGFSYYDCWVDDSRLVISNAIAARTKGAKIYTQHKVTHARRLEDRWEITVLNNETKQTVQYYARALVNASGPWLNDLLGKIPNEKNSHVQLIKGSHIVIKKHYQAEHAYIFQNDDKRVVFAIPYGEQHTLIGTTDVACDDSYKTPKISKQEVDYLCSCVSKYFNQAVTADDIVWSYSGIRPLQAGEEDNPSAITRDYSIVIEDKNNKLPVATVLGGKITTYRKLAEHALDQLQSYFPEKSGAWTEQATLPGGGDTSQFKSKYEWLPKEVLARYLTSYGDLTSFILKGCEKLTDLGQDFGAGLYQCEVDYLCREEWATTAEDILWRRTKLGLYLSDEQVTNLSQYLDSERAVALPA